MDDAHPLVRRFGAFSPLSPAEEAQLRSLSAGGLRTNPARRDLVREGERPAVVYLILSGWAFRYKVLPDGRRPILQFLVSGDLCDIYNDVLGTMDHSIGALTEITYAEVPHERIAELECASPALRQALWWHTMTTVAIQREWTVNIGQRSATERLSHLFCEIFLRLRVTGLTRGDSCELPVTQTDLADATGLTSVHVNRTLQDLREIGLIVLRNRRLTIPDFAALSEVAMFSPGYLHLGDDSEMEPSASRRAARR